jgi:diamine N-acetyltransferase
MTNSAAFSLRAATPDDAAALSELGRKTFIENFGHMYSSRNLNDFLDGIYMPRLQLDEIAYPENRVALIWMNGNPVGYAKSGPCKLPVENLLQPSYELHRLYLMPEAQGIGAGAALMRDALDFCEERGAAGIYLGVWEENHKAQAFYKKFGFEYAGRYEFMVGEHADRELILRYRAK